MDYDHLMPQKLLMSGYAAQRDTTKWSLLVFKHLLLC